MKKPLALTLSLCALIALAPPVQAAPKNMERRKAQIAEMAKDKETRLMMIRQLMSTAEGKKEMAEMLKHDAEFRSFYEANNVDPG